MTHHFNQKPIIYKDFTAGLYDRQNDRDCAEHGLLEMTDCYPLVQGGLRAGPAWTTSITGTNMNPGAVNGFYIPPALDFRGNTGFPKVRLYWAISSYTGFAGGRNALEIWESQDGAAPTKVSTQGILAGNATWNWPVRFTTQLVNRGGTLTHKDYYQLVGTAMAGGDGIWRIDIATPTSSATNVLVATSTTYLTSHQSRLVYSQVSGLHATTISFSDNGLVTNNDTSWAVANPIQVGDGRASSLCFVEPMFSSDLACLKKEHGFFVIQGDLFAGPSQREMHTSHPPQDVAWPAKVAGRFAYATTSEGIYLWSGGGDVEHISPQIISSKIAPIIFSGTLLGSTWNFLGQPIFGGNWLFTSNGYVWNEPTRSWFKTSIPSLPTNFVGFFQLDQSQGRVWATANDGNGNVFGYFAGTNEGSMARSNTWAITLPILDLEARQIEVANVEVFGVAKGTNPTFTLTITNPSGAQAAITSPVLAASGPISHSFGTQGGRAGSNADWIKIRIQGFATSGEAPQLERVAVFTQPRQMRSK